MADTVVFDGDTELGHYQVIDTIYEGRQARVLYSGLRLTAQSGVAQDDNPDLLFDYNQRFLEIVESVKPKNLLLIGGGAFTLPKALLQNYPQLQIDVVEIDAGLQAIAERYFGLQKSPRLHSHHTDGLEFLRQDRRAYDVIIVDVFTQAVIPEPFLEPETALLIYEHLSPGGVAAMNIISPYYGSNNGVIKQLDTAYRAAFPHVDIYPAGRALFSLWLPQNLVLAAQKGTVRELQLRYGRLAPLE